MRKNTDGSPLVTVIIPVINPDKAERAAAFAIENAGIDKELIELLVEEDTDRVGCPKMVARMSAKARTQLVCFLGEDTLPLPDYLKVALDVMDTLPDGWGIVGFNDMIQDGRAFATHWVADKRMLPLLDGEFFHTGYLHNYCDREMTDRAKDVKRYAWAEDAKVRHDHPFASPDEQPEIYRAEEYRRDFLLYRRRAVERYAGGGIKLGIGFPIASSMIESDFFWSYVAMEKPDHTLLRPRFPVDDFAHNHAAVRNDMCWQALENGLTHILMMDTDQIYPDNAIQQMLRHVDKDVVGAVIHRRWPQFDPVLYRGRAGHYTHVPDEECYCGDLIEIDATGAGMLLINTNVLLNVDTPWFNADTFNDAGHPIGEDIYFCTQVREKGFRIWCDTSIAIDHIGKVGINRAFYQIYKKIRGFEWRQPEKSET